MTTKKKTTNKKEKTKNKLIIVLGLKGTPEHGWYPWLKGEVGKKSWEVCVPYLPNSNDPKVHEWLLALIQSTGEVNKNTFMVGHSLGCIAILRFLETLKDGESIGGAVFVAGFDNNLGEKEIQSFF